MLSKSWFKEKWRQVQGSYWFIPSFMAFCALLLSQFTLYYDQQVGTDWIEYWEFLYATKADGARAILSTIAGSMIGVAGVTFSITIAAVAYASGQFGPRIIDNFMEDRGNQITLGTFISTFLYCLLVLRTVRAAEDGGFVPYGSMATAVFLALASLGVLIYFIHHIPESIHVYHVVADIGNQLSRQADRLFPESVGQIDAERGEANQPSLDEPTHIIRAPVSGYIQSIEGDNLVALAGRGDSLVKLTVEPGEFVAASTILGKVYGPGDSLNYEHCFLIGRERSPAQDIRFLMDKLVDIAARALSPGVNDPYTAISCIDWLNAFFIKIGQREMSSPYRRDKNGRIALVVVRPDFETLLAEYWDKLRPYVEKDRNVTLHMLESAVRAMDVLSPQKAVAVHTAAQHLVAGALEYLTHPRDREQLQSAQKALAEANSTGSWKKKAQKAFQITA